MIKQNGLFGNIPVIQPKKAINKALVEKAKTPKKSKAGASNVVRIEEVYNVVMPQYRDKIQKLRPNHTFELITDEQRLRNYLVNIEKNGIVSYDTEASGTDEIDDKVCGLCLYTPGETAAYVPCAHIGYEKNVDVDWFIEALISLSRSGRVKVVMANAKFDVRITHNTFLNKEYIKTHWDVILAAKFLNENLKSKALKFLWQYYVLGNKEIKITELDNYKKLFGNLKFNTLDPEKVYWYAAMDGLETQEVYEFQKPFLTVGSELTKDYNLEKTAVLAEDEMLLTEIVGEMEDIGIHIDIKQSFDLSEKYHAKMAKCARDFMAHVKMLEPDYITPFRISNPERASKLGDPINPASPTQLTILFYDILQLKGKNGKLGKGTGEDVLIDLKNRYPRFEGLFSSLLDIRKNSKQLSTYIDKFPKLIKEQTGRLHGQYNIYGTDTGRMSSKAPNLQNIPKYTGVRKMFTATPGYLMIGCDYSQQEPRLLSFLCGDEAMKQAYIDEKDLYAQMAHDIYGGSYTDYLKKDEAIAQGATYNPKGEKIRDRIKAILLGIMYSKGAKSIAEELGITLDEAKNTIKLFHDKFPKVPAYEAYQQEFAKREGYVQTVRGRKRRLPDLNLPKYSFTDMNGGPADEKTINQLTYNLDNTWDWKERNRLIEVWRQNLGVRVKDNGGFIAQAKRQVVNSIMQGSAGDMTKLAMILIHKSKRMKELKGRMLLLIHDEIIIEAPAENAKEASALLEALMIEAASMLMDVPVKCDSEIYKCWEGEQLVL